MSSFLCKVESGIQLMSRLCKKPNLELFYSTLFNAPPKYGEIIELSKDDGQTFLLNDILSEVLLPIKYGGSNCEVVIFSSDGNFCSDNLVQFIAYKIRSNQPSNFNDLTDIQPTSRECLKKLHLLEVYDSTQMYSTIYNLEKILSHNSNISLIVFDSLTAFYWSEQGYKIMRMDLYVKNLLNMILKVTKDYKIIILFTKPEYFNSDKDIHNDQPLIIQYQIQTKCLDNENIYNIVVRLHNKQFMRKLVVKDNHVVWLY